MSGDSSVRDSALSVDQLVGGGNDEPVGPKWFNEYLRPCLAEFIAVMLFVFVGTMAVVVGQPIAIATAHGFMIALLVASFGPVSGGHINPAVTLGICLSGGIPFMKAILYLISQLAGSVVGAFITRGALSFEVSQNMTQYAAISGGGHTLGAGVTPAMALLTESGITFVLVMTVLMTAVNTDAKNPIHPLAIGFAVLAGILAGIKISGGSMNPARSFGPVVGLSGLGNLWPYHWIYWAGPAIGAVLAALFFRLIFGRPDKRLLYKED